MSSGRIALAFSLLVALSSTAAGDGRTPGSVLIYPIHRSLAGAGKPIGIPFFTALSVTNTNLKPITPNNALGGSTSIHWEYVNVIPGPTNNLPSDCQVVDVVEFLTPADTLTVLTNCHNASGGQEGYVVVSAQDPNQFGVAWSHNYLVGSEFVVSGAGVVYSVEAIPFDAVGTAGQLTDADGDGQLDFDGIEYEGVPDQIYLDSFLAVSGSSITLLNLTGGFQHIANVAIDLWNDAEHALSTTLAFRCWIEEPIGDVSILFSSDFLTQNTAHDPAELDFNCDGIGDAETGWARIRGLNASSPAETIPDPALLGAIVAGPAGGASIGAGHLMWESKARQLNGDFFKTGTDDPEFPAGPPPVTTLACGFEVPSEDGGRVDAIFEEGAGIDVEFDASASTGIIVTFEWDFGDGNTTTTNGPLVAHNYETSGPYTVTLTVRDAKSAVACTRPILLNYRPIAILEQTCPPPSGAAFETLSLHTIVGFKSYDSYDPDGVDGIVAEYRWYLNGPDIYEEFPKRYPEPDPGQPRLREDLLDLLQSSIQNLEFRQDKCFEELGTHVAELVVIDTLGAANIDAFGNRSSLDQGMRLYEIEPITQPHVSIAAPCYVKYASNGSSDPNPGTSVTLTPFVSLPAGDEIQSLTWDFGDDNPNSSPGSPSACSLVPTFKLDQRVDHGYALSSTPYSPAVTVVTKSGRTLEAKLKFTLPAATSVTGSGAALAATHEVVLNLSPESQVSASQQFIDLSSGPVTLQLSAATSFDKKAGGKTAPPVSYWWYLEPEHPIPTRRTTTPELDWTVDDPSDGGFVVVIDDSDDPGNNVAKIFITFQ